ncbi:MAG: hypothetical protein LBQ16_02445 [Gracilibacteraceae bacterium]|jgi:hypothetical protein|nr:hypothetical protein [Gracilibacteraceae bacterium]
MQKIVSVMTLCLFAAAGLFGCAAQTPAVDPVQTAYIYADFSFGVPGAEEKDAIRRYEFSYTGKLSLETLINELNRLTGLSFIVAGGVDAGVARVDWQTDSTLVAGLDDRAQKDEFHFYDAESLNWFMMDTLWRTITSGLGVTEVYYSMDGGEPLKPFGSLRQCPADVPYMGSVYYQSSNEPPPPELPPVLEEDEGPLADNKYFDEQNRITLHYPGTFSLDGRVHPISGHMEFLSRQDDTVLSFWVEPNEDGETPKDFWTRHDGPNAQIRWLYDNPNSGVIIFAHEAFDADERKRGYVYQFVVEEERIINIRVECAPAMLEYWYENMDLDFSLT